MTNDYGNLELHMVLLDAMKVIDRICRENNLKYYLYAGTLLGAVKHKGFIPWDDDVDIAMFPSDYQKLEEIVKKQYSDYFEICTFNTNSTWHSKMNKLLIKGTRFITTNGEEGMPFFIDIALFHNVPEKKYQQVFQQKCIQAITMILSVQGGVIVPTSFKSRIILGNLAKVKRNFWGKVMDKIMTIYDGKNTSYVGIMSNTLVKSPYTGLNNYYNDMNKREDLESPINLPFEDACFMCFANPENDLFRHYGEGWICPFPKKKRITKHDVKTYIIDEAVKKRVGINLF